MRGRVNNFSEYKDICDRGISLAKALGHL